ncbi:P-loop containing nucleoside triphosphate hydrolase protein [Infundibulicybe gibba]|nr:P-loop containing nucleoside triphosphate hydrolase protein [Infundibulicybe gibba]
MADLATFSSLSHLLDARLLRALADSGFARPTLVQAKAIPLALEGRDILARARTGSGKTVAYCIPVVQKIISVKASLGVEDPLRRATRALILVPTRELAEQVSASLRNLVKYCDNDILIVNAASGATTHLQRVLLADKPDVVIATPSRALALLQSKTLSVSALESLVIDEADLILSYGHDEDVRQIFSGAFLPKVHQSFLMSATMTEDVEMLKGLTLRNAAILRLEENEDEAAHLSQYAVRCSEVDKFLLTYVILKLKLIRGKCILFVNDVDRSYRLKLFLEQFSIKSCVLILSFRSTHEFNKGVYDYIIATDESGAQLERDSDDEEAEPEESLETPTEEEFTSTQREPEDTAIQRSPRNPSQIPNPENASVQLPPHLHQRPASGNTGDEGVFTRIEKEQGARGSKIKEYNFDMKQVEAFRYRMEDALRSVTRSAVREARIKELKSEILNSDKLKAHFEDNPLDLDSSATTNRSTQRVCNRI